MSFSWGEVLWGSALAILVFASVLTAGAYKDLRKQVIESEPIKLEKNVYMCSQVAL